MGSLTELTMNWRSAMLIMVLVPLMLCGGLLVLRRIEARAARPLGVFLILAGLSLGPQLIGFADGYQLWPWLTFFPLFFVDLWLPPLLIAHARYLTHGGGLGWRKWLFLPGLIQTLYYMGAFFLPGDGLFDTPAKWAFNDVVHGPIWIPIETGFGIGLMILALICLWRDRKAYTEFLERNSSAARDYDPVWLRNIVIAALLAGVIYAGLEIADLIIKISYVAAFPFQVGLLAILAWLGLDAAWRLTVPFPKIRAEAESAAGPDDLADRILSRMKTERWFLEPSLSIRDVARRMGSNESYVSRALNASGDSFNRTVNGLRVELAKESLATSDTPILTIAMDSGFNSKATFNRVFRDIVGETPSRFRQQKMASQKP